LITNASLTVYHKTFNQTTRLEEWVRYNYANIWWYGGRGTGINKGYDKANDVKIRIPYDKNINLNITNFEIGDILVKGTLSSEITTQQDLDSYEVYNITSINNNTTGDNKHIYLGGK
jgi:hypothetical protein